MASPARSRLVEVLYTGEESEARTEHVRAVERLKRTGMNSALSVWCGKVAGVWQVWLLRK